MTDSSAKICVVCGQNCAAKPRTKDARGRYFCMECYQQAKAQQQAAPRTQGTSAPPPASDSAPRSAASPRADDQGEYALEASPAAPIARPTSMKSGSDRVVAQPQMRAPALRLPTGKIAPAQCPSCAAALPAGTLVCIPCGINVATGRSINTAEQVDVKQLHETARGILWFASWLLWLGLMPIASEAHGSRTPWALRSLALATVLFTMFMWWFDWTESPRMQSLKNQYLWAGNAEPDATYIEEFYEYTAYGDWEAFEDKKAELRASVPRPELAQAALSTLPPAQRCFGEFRPWQLITHAFLHADVLHLAGNMLFMLVFGLRINALIGNVGTLIIYPLLAVIAALAQMASMQEEMPAPMLGASGAIMGLAGMYFILFPVSPVHVAAFIRVPVLLLGFFKCRGLWILLFYIAFDVLFTILQSEDGTAHWAHMGGFLAGMAIALLLLFTRGVNARGNDLISVLLGRQAWALLGKPSQWRDQPDGEGWLTRARILPESLCDELAATFRPDRA